MKLRTMVTLLVASWLLMGCCRSECPPCASASDPQPNVVSPDERAATTPPDPTESEAPEPELGPAAADQEPAPVAPSTPEPAPPAAPAEQQEVAEAGARPAVIRVALYQAPGVSVEALLTTERILRETPGFEPVIVTPEEVRAGALNGRHVVIFTGGRGSVQGRLLEETGRQIVRDFVAGGGGYVGVCAGSYLAIQGPEEFYKIAIVAAENLSGDAWQRGMGTARIQEVGGSREHRLFYANGPVFRRLELPGFRPFVTLATFVSDFYLPAHGTESGQMPSTPAILASSYHRGRILLFSPNPVLAAEGEEARGDLMIDAVRWAATPGPVPATLAFGDVFVSSH